MRELVGGKNTIRRTAAVLKIPIKRPLPFTFTVVYCLSILCILLYPYSASALEMGECTYIYIYIYISINTHTHIGYVEAEGSTKPPTRGHRSAPPRVRRPGRVTGHSRPFNAELKS